MNEFWITITTIFGSLATVAIIGELVSKNAQTPQVVGAISQGYASDLSVALSPVTGNSNNFSIANLSNEYN